MGNIFAKHPAHDATSQPEPNSNKPEANNQENFNPAPAPPSQPQEYSNRTEVAPSHPQPQADSSRPEWNNLAYGHGPGTLVKDNLVIGDPSKVLIGEGNYGGRYTGGRVTGNRVMR